MASAEEFGTSRLRLPREERQEVVASLRESGLSTRAIASATGIADQTVRADLAQVREITQASVTGTDGKTYAPHPEPNTWTPAEPPAPPTPKRRPLPDAFATAVVDLTRAAERLARLTDDDRFNRHLDALSTTEATTNRQETNQP